MFFIKSSKASFKNELFLVCKTSMINYDLKEKYQIVYKLNNNLINGI